MTDRERIRLLRNCLKTCAATFRAYETMHMLKVPPAEVKAKRNGDFAETCELVLKTTQQEDNRRG